MEEWEKRGEATLCLHERELGCPVPLLDQDTSLNLGHHQPDMNSKRWKMQYSLVATTTGVICIAAVLNLLSKKNDRSSLSYGFLPTGNSPP